MDYFSLFRVGYSYTSDLRDYVKEPPFDPPVKYSELSIIKEKGIDEKNGIYPVVKDIIEKLCIDRNRPGKTVYNPLKDIIKPGNKVLIKPNLVTDYHYLGKEAVLGTIVHGSVLRPLLDHIAIALEGDGFVTIADAPIEHAEFKHLMAISQIERMIEKISRNGHGLKWQIIDLRQKITDGQKIVNNENCDPLGYIEIDLGNKSCFAEFDSAQNTHYYTLADKSIDHLNHDGRKASTTDKYHNLKCHKYVIARSILDADVIVNVAKLKTHCKAGVSLCLKNLIGIVSTKDCMPHHRPGSPPEGDAFPAKPPSYYTESRKVYRDLRKGIAVHKFPGVTAALNLLRKKKIIVGQQIEHGSWKGNDTLWRTILDVNRIAVYADKKGVMRDTPQRKFFHLIDGIIGQEGDAPISGTPKPCGILVGGFNPIMVDALACKIMGIDYRMIKTITEAKKLKKWPLLTEDVDLSLPDIETPNLRFELPKGWK